MAIDRFLLWELILEMTRVLADLPSHEMAFSQIATLTAHISFLLSELIFGWPSVGRSTPLFNADFTDSCFDSSYFIPTLRTHIWLTKCWQIYPPSNGNFTDCCSDSSYFIPTLRTHIWHSRCWQIYSPHQMAIIDSYSESSYLADQVLADLHPHQTADFTDSCSDNSYFIPTLRAHIR